MPILGRFIKLTIENNSFQKCVFSRNSTPNSAPNLKPILPQSAHTSASKICNLSRKRSGAPPKNPRAAPPPSVFPTICSAKLRALVLVPERTHERRRWRLPGAGALLDVRGLQLDQGGVECTDTSLANISAAILIDIVTADPGGARLRSARSQNERKSTRRLRR